MLLTFQLVQIVYWLALATWFGAVLFAVLAPPVVLRTVREADPMLPHVLSVNLEGQHGTLLGGSIVVDLFRMIARVELVAAIVLLPALVVQWLLVDRDGVNLVQPILRTALYVFAVGLLVYDWRVIWPKVVRYRQEYLDNADNPDVANPALDQFDRYQSESMALLRTILFALLGMILFSAAIRPAATAIIFQGAE